jgi:hypothetical protein
MEGHANITLLGHQPSVIPEKPSALTFHIIPAFVCAPPAMRGRRIDQAPMLSDARAGDSPAGAAKAA